MTPVARSQIPKWTVQAAAQYDSEPLFEEAYLSFRLDANYRSAYYGNFNPMPAVGATGGTLPPELLALFGLPNTAAGRLTYMEMLDRQQVIGVFWLANARVSLSNVKLGGSRAKLSAFARNLFNERNGIVSAQNFGVAVGAIWVEKRTFGIDLSVDF